ncbi:hypothetical protein GO013_05480 [Pseudodesulfovibrio sp. JC047]|uniref:SHOCT domain-containing protein n=1 Tax=Pseudodesulfovibrio sp. JC047 TaxID=2683199 RepID=UPI0013D8332A|nr:SHOCT domain-containing protein [Pseudodesulfovibrio sp. JC047]NDV18869.1 hypothetical protein [Pseudodesulfovibrio sp. JC047]
MEFFSTIGNWCSNAGFWHSGGHGAGGWMPFHFGGILPLIIIGLIIYFTVRMFRKPATHTGPDDPETILKRRYAAGEISVTDYETMKKNL